MNLQLRNLKQPADNLREVLLGFAEGLLQDIDRLEEDTPTRIHDIRVATKKMRALLRLCGDLISEVDGEKHAVSLREIRNTFAGTRDLEVMRLRLEELFPLEQAGAAVALLGLMVNPDEPLPERTRARELAGELKSRLEQTKLELLTAEQMLENAGASYRKARKLLRKNRRKPQTEAMHDWRKRTKDVCYHALAMAELKPAGKNAAALDALAESLGEYHDLALLEERADKHPQLIKVIAARRKAVGKACFKAGEKLFKAAPSNYVKKLRRALG